MGSVTQNLGLALPATTDNVSITVLDENFELIDTALGTAALIKQLDLVVDAKRDSNASGSSQSTTTSAQFTAGSYTPHLTSALDFQNGEGISIAGAGASGGLLVTSILLGAGTTTPTLAAPCQTTVASGAAVLHDDTVAVQGLITAGKPIFLGNNGENFNVSTMLLLSPYSVVLGINKQIWTTDAISSTITWTGPAGGVVVGTAALSTGPQPFQGMLKDFGINYPYSALTSTSRCVYIALPSNDIDLSLVITGWDSNYGIEPVVTGSVLLELDGCANPGQFKVRIMSGGPVEKNILVRCNHANIQATECAYANYAVEVNNDSIASGSGPPYNVNIYGLHAYQNQVALLHLIAAHSVNVFGGMLESTQSYYAVAESTFAGTCTINDVQTLGTKTVTNAGTGVIDLNNRSSYYQGVYQKASCGGLIDVALNPVTKFVMFYINPGTTNLTDTVQNYAVFAGGFPSFYPAIGNGSLNRTLVKLTGNLRNYTPGDGVTVKVWADTAAPTIGGAPGGGATAILTWTLTQPSGDYSDHPFALAILNYQSGPLYYYVSLACVTGGQCVMDTTVLEIEAM